MFRAVTAGLAAAVAVLLIAEPAAAHVQDPVRSAQWKVTECGQGKLTGAFREPRGGVIVTGEAKECGGHVPGSFFAIATFHVRDPANRPYAEFEDARFFRKERARSFGVHAFRGSGVEAVCLMVSPTKRLDCAWVVVPEIGPARITPLNPQDPVVAKPVELGPQDPSDNDGSSTKCANCW
jgi:hypothetical protein